MNTRIRLDFRNTLNWVLTLTVAAVLAAGCAPAQPGYCGYSWAYGEGSPVFDEIVKQELQAAAIDGTVRSSSYGETSCDGFHPGWLDVNIEVGTTNTVGKQDMIRMAADIHTVVENHLADSGLPNLGNVSLRFVDPGNRECDWLFDTGELRCSP